MAKENKANKKPITKHSKHIEPETLSTDAPISEKDEVKKAEQRTQQQQKKVSR